MYNSVVCGGDEVCMGMCVCECVCECIKVHADSIDYYYADTSWTYSTHIIIIMKNFLEKESRSATL